MKTANHPTFTAFQVLLGPLQELVELGTGWYKLQEHLAPEELSVFLNHRRYIFSLFDL